MDWEAQREIKGSLEEVGEGDQTVVVVATLDGPVNSGPTALFLQVAAIRAHSCFFPSMGCQIFNDSYNDLEEERVMKAQGGGALTGRKG